MKKNDLYTIKVSPKRGYFNPRCVEGETILSFTFEDCTLEHVIRLKEINEHVWKDDAIITITKQGRY